MAKARKRSPRTQAQYEAYIALVRAAEDMNRDFVELLKTEDLSDAQYNVLRVLRGAGGDGLACREIGDRLIRHDPDVTRLLDRLEQRKLIARARDLRDRRVVRTTITEEGLARLARLDQPVDDMHEQQLGHLSEARLKELQAIVEEARRKS
jgi:DNA-binding MarR family transcriptional regulator